MNIFSLTFFLTISSLDIILNFEVDRTRADMYCFHVCELCARLVHRRELQAFPVDSGPQAVFAGAFAAVASFFTSHFASIAQRVVRLTCHIISLNNGCHGRHHVFNEWRRWSSFQFYVSNFCADPAISHRCSTRYR